MKRFVVFFIFLLLNLCGFSIRVYAHHTDDHVVGLHTNDKWDDCAIVIDPALSQSEWRTFARDISSIIYFKPTDGVKPLGKGNVAVALISARAEPLKDYQGSWN